MINDYEVEQYQRKMVEWSKNHPLAFEIIFGNMSFEEKVAYAERLYPGGSNDK